MEVNGLLGAPKTASGVQSLKSTTAWEVSIM